MNIDYAKLTLKDALDLAILIEEEAQERYVELAEQLEQHRTPEAAKFFRFMSQNEEKHGAELARKRMRLFGDAPTSVTRAMIFDVEAPEYDEARAFMTARAALHVAFAAEKKAYQFFTDALPQVNGEVKELFTELREEEVQHQRMVLAELEKTPPDHALATWGVPDEPTAQ